MFGENADVSSGVASCDHLSNVAGIKDEVRELEALNLASPQKRGWTVAIFHSRDPTNIFVPMLEPLPMLR